MECLTQRAQRPPRREFYEYIDPDTIVAAVRDQLVLKLTLEGRAMPILVVEKAGGKE
jgi:hypothetical protein